MTIAQMRQAIYEALHQLEDDYAVAYSRGATIYVNPTNGMGEDVIPRTRDGRPVAKMNCSAPYSCAADALKP
jgi:hypothetical protein